MLTIRVAFRLKKTVKGHLGLAKSRNQNLLRAKQKIGEGKFIILICFEIFP